jgi:hypothetical protein
VAKAKTKSPEEWRDWTANDKAANPRRVCSVAGCREEPVRAKETKTPRGRTRTHVYCAKHAQENGG